METEKTIAAYLKGLERGDAKRILALFEKGAMASSPLYGRIKASKFYKELFSDTTKSKITPLNSFISKSNKNVGAAHFRYDWTLKDGTPTSFECVDVFRFSKNGKIRHITIIYDTHKLRAAFNKIKK